MIAIEDTMILDIETDEDQLVAVGISGAFEDDVTHCYPGNAVPEWVWQALAGNVWIVEQTLYDARFLAKLGHPVTNIVDIRALAHADNENGPFDLESMAYRYCGIAMDKRIKREAKVPLFKLDDGSKVRVRDVPWDQLERYLKGDVDATRSIYRTVRKRLGYEKVDEVTTFTNVLFRMQQRGLPVDEAGVEALTRRYKDVLDEMDLRLRVEGNLPEVFNFNSSVQLAQFLYTTSFTIPGKVRIGDPVPPGFEVTSSKKVWRYGTWSIKGMGLPIPGWTGDNPGEGQPKTDAKTLAVRFGNKPWVTQYLEAAKYRTALSWLESLPTHVQNGRVHGEFNQAGTVTGRLSSSSPNLQNIPRRGEIGDEIRSLFVGDLVVADFSQLEPRIAAHLSQDPVLLEIFRSGQDLYEVMSDHVGCERDESKQLYLSISYGAQSRKTAENLSVAGFYTTQRQAQGYLDHVTDLFSGFFEWREKTIKRAYHRGYAETIGGRQRHLNFRGAADAWRLERQTVNSEVQGSAADVVNGTMVKVDEDLPQLLMLAQVHDELVLAWNVDWQFDPDEVLRWLQLAGEHGHGFELSVPLVFEPKRVQRWSEK